MVLVKIEIDEIGWNSSFYRAFNSKNFSSDYLCLNSHIFVDRNLVSFEFLIPWVAELVFLIQVDPKLESI